MFVGDEDSYILRDGRRGSGHWHLVGAENEGKYQGPKMADYLTYDEIKLSALVQVSSPIMPINR